MKPVIPPLSRANSQANLVDTEEQKKTSAESQSKSQTSSEEGDKTSAEKTATPQQSPRIVPSWISSKSEVTQTMSAAPKPVPKLNLPVLPSTAPTLSPRKPPADTPPPLPNSSRNFGNASHSSNTSNPSNSSNHSAWTTTTTNTTATTTTTSTNSTSTTTKVAAGRTSYLLPELASGNKKKILDPTLLAKQLIAGESQNYTRPLSGSAVPTLLRQAIPMKEKLPDVVEIPADENAITVYLEPFMNHYFDTPAVNEKLQAIQHGYEQKQPEIQAMYDNEGARNFSRSDKVKTVMLPIISPIVKFICGEKNSLASSGLPKPVLELMLAVDEEVQIWFAKNGNGNAEDLKTARQNALKSFFGTRSFMARFTLDLAKDKNKPDRFYTPLVGYLNTYLNVQIEDFVASMMSCTPEQRAQIKKEAKIITSRPMLAEKEQKALDANKDRVLNRKPTKLINRFNDALDIKPKSGSEAPTSPRKPIQRRKTLEGKMPGSENDEGLAPLSSPRRQLPADKKVEQDSAKAIALSRKRKATAGEYLKLIKLSQYEDFSEMGSVIREFSTHIVDASRKDYQDFKKSPDKVLLNFIEAFIAKQRTFGNAPSNGLQAFQADLRKRVLSILPNPFADDQ